MAARFNRMAEETHNTSADPTVRRYQILMDVAESISLHSDLPALFHDLAARLQRVASFRSLWLVLHDPARNTMRLHHS
jgi:hypothetical protein